MNLIALPSKFHTTCCNRARISRDDRAKRVQHAFQTNSLELRRRLHRLHRRLDHVYQRQALHVEADASRHDATQIEQVFYQLDLRACIALNRLGSLAKVFVTDRLLLAQYLRPTQDGVERGAQLMRQRGQELVFHAHGALCLDAGIALGFEQRLALRVGGLQRFAPLALGQVTRELGKATQAAFLVAQRSDDDVGPEPRAVFAHAPAFIDETSALGGNLQLVFGPSALHQIQRIEAREVLPNDLRCSEPFDALSAFIPCHDVAVGVEHEDAVVSDPFDEQAEALLALSQRLFVLLALRQIARDFGEAAQLAVLPEGCDDDVGPERGAVFAHPPAFILEATLLASEFQLAFGPAALHLLDRVETREMLADDLIRLVALDPSHARIAGENDPGRVEQEHRVVLVGLDQQAQQLTRSACHRGRREVGRESTRACVIEIDLAFPESSSTNTPELVAIKRTAGANHSVEDGFGEHCDAAGQVAINARG